MGITDMGNPSSQDNVDIGDILQKTEKSNEWIRKHYEELKAKHEGEVFAVKDEKLVASNKDIMGLLEDVKKKGEDPMFLVIGSIPRKGVSFIL